VASYSMGELSLADALQVVDAAWRACGGALVIVEPGTPAGYARVIAARDQLIRRGARGRNFAGTR